MTDAKKDEKDVMEAIVGAAEYGASSLSERTIYELVSKLFDRAYLRMASVLTQPRLRMHAMLDVMDAHFWRKYAVRKHVKKGRYDAFTEQNVRLMEMYVSLGGRGREDVVRTTTRQEYVEMPLGIKDKLLNAGRREGMQ